MKSLAELTYKLAAYASLPFQYPGNAPGLIRDVLFQRALTSELMRLTPGRNWIRKVGFSTCLDVGAYTGAFAYALRHLLPEIHIYSFEPLKESFDLLNHNLKRFGRFESFQTALGSRRGEITFWRSGFAPSSSALPMADLHRTAFPQTSSTTATKVPVARLDEISRGLSLSPPVLLKMDVQGYELEVLRGARRTLASVDWVWTEVSFQALYQGQADFDSLYRFLYTAGFRLAGLTEPLLSPLDGSILQADLIFKRGA